MQKSGIYKIEFEDSSFYIGQSLNLDTRFKDHCKLLLAGVHHNYKMQQKYDKFKKFPTYTIIKYCEPELLNDFESELIDLSNPKCLNIKAGGNNNYGANAITAKYATEDIEMAFLILVNNPGILHKEVAEFVGIDINTVHDISAGRNRVFTEIRKMYPEKYDLLLKMKAANTKGKTTVVLQHLDGRIVNLVSGEYSEFCRNNSVQSSNLSKVITGKRVSTMGWKLIEKYENI
jgi:hypothetical protein